MTAYNASNFARLVLGLNGHPLGRYMRLWSAYGPSAALAAYIEGKLDD